MTGYKFSVLKWTGLIGHPLVIEAHEHHEIIHAGTGPGLAPDEFAIWMAMPVVERGTTGWERTFQVFGTGQPLPQYARPIQSWVAGPFVWHLFELRENTDGRATMG